MGGVGSQFGARQIFKRRAPTGSKKTNIEAQAFKIHQPYAYHPLDPYLFMSPGTTLEKE